MAVVFGRFMDTMRQYNALPRLQKDEELALIRRWQTSRDKKAADRVVNANLRYVGDVAWRFRNSGQSLDDLVSEGVFGLLHALDKFDCDRDVRFNTYAHHWVGHYVKAYIDQLRSIVSLDRCKRALQHVWSFAKVRARLRMVYGDDYRLIEQKVSEQFGVPIEKVQTVFRIIDTRPISLDTPVSGDDGDCRSAMVDTIPSPDASPEDMVADIESGEVRREYLEDALASLSEPERAVIRHMYYTEDGSFVTFGEARGFSRQRSQQYEVRAKKKIRQRLEPHRGMIPL